MKKNAFILFLALLTVLFVACKKPVEPTPTEAPVTIAPSAAPTEVPTPEPTPTAEPTPTPVPTLPDRLSCIDGKEIVDFIYEGGGYITLLCCDAKAYSEDDWEEGEGEDDWEEGEGDWEEGEGEEIDYDEYINSQDWDGGFEPTGTGIYENYWNYELRRINLWTDTVEAMRENYAEIDFLGARANGEILAYFGVARRLLVFDSALKLKHSQELICDSIRFDRANDRLLYTSYEVGEALLGFDFNTTEEVVDIDIRAFSVDGSNGGILCGESTFYTMLYLPDEERTVVFDDFDRPDYYVRTVAGESCILIKSDWKEGADSIDSLIVLDLASGNETCYSIEGGETSKAFGSSATPYVLLRGSFREDDAYLPVPMNRLFDTRNGSYCSIDGCIREGFEIISAEYASDIGRWIVVSIDSSARIEQDGSKVCELTLIDPEALEYDGKLTSGQAPSALEDYLLASRSKADEIEEKYGVSIRFGNEYHGELEYAPNKDFKKEDVPVLDNLLGLFDRAFDEYPEEFWDMFSSCYPVIGLRFILAPNILTPGIGEAGGCVDARDGQTNVYISLNSNEATIHHELWHAVQEAMFKHTGELYFESEAWTELNPEGFGYIGYGDYYDFDSYGPYLNYLLTQDVDPYFSRAYSLTNSDEDRATLVEELLAWSDMDLIHSYPNRRAKYEHLCSYPHIKAKYDYMAERLMEAFGFVYWETMLNGD